MKMRHVLSESIPKALQKFRISICGRTTPTNDNTDVQQERYRLRLTSDINATAVIRLRFVNCVSMGVLAPSAKTCRRDISH